MPVADGRLRPQLLYLKRRDSCFVRPTCRPSELSLLLQSDWEAELRAGYFRQQLGRGTTSHADILDSWERSPTESHVTADVPLPAPGTVTRSPSLSLSAWAQPVKTGLAALPVGWVVGLSSLPRSADPAASATAQENMLPPGSRCMRRDSQGMVGAGRKQEDSSSSTLWA